jgi:catechol 2,3-dioxygenase-like lactoylglutathione lyase family enzyme
MSVPRWFRGVLCVAAFGLVAIGCTRQVDPPSAFASPGAARAAAQEHARVHAVGCIGVPVSNLEHAKDFYTGVLQFRTAEGSGGAREPHERAVRLALGRECIELREPVGGVRHAVPADSQSNDRWFQHVAIVVRDIDRAYARLERYHVVHVSPEPQRLPEWNKSAANVRAYYFKDPDAHTLELISFPDDKGDPRWHVAPGDDLFLGIDHTAIAVGDTDASLSFYVAGLGFRVAGTSENWGPEQERLNAVAGAHLRITTLRAAVGPGVELLQYLTPTTGRPLPADERDDDLTHWRTVIYADGVETAHEIRDPDGHALELSPHGPSLPQHAPAPKGDGRFGEEP